MKKIDNNYLSHHGVKGMKWGVRKDRKKAVHLMNTFSRRAEKFYKKSDKLYKNTRPSQAKSDNDVKKDKKRFEDTDKYFYTHVNPAYKKVMNDSTAKLMIDAYNKNIRNNTKHKANKIIERFWDAEWKLTGAANNMADAYLSYDYNQKIKKKPKFNKKLRMNYDEITW